MPDGSSVWTGTKGNGEKGDFNCNNWSDTQGVGLIGRASDITNSWTDNGAVGCSLTVRLYCFGESDLNSTPTPLPTSTPTATPIPTLAPNIPNDPYYSSTGSWGQTYPDLWGMKKINLEPAWIQTTGSASIVVASIDTGVDRNHEDIASNMWVNTKEIPGNGIDDDGNGYIDDYYGWDFANNDNDPMDDNSHGTHTAGTIGAVGNNGKGVVGVNWTSKIMALKICNSSGSCPTGNAVKAFQYAADMGAKVSSNSWGGVFQNSALADAVKYEHDKGMVIVAGAGNDNGDALDFSPASSDYAITVAASDPNDLKASFSNWGEKIDVAAPGVEILSTRTSVNPTCAPASETIGPNYCRMSGTSMATPHVAGLAALLLSKNPALTNEEIRQIIRNGADDLGAVGKDASFGYGRINATGSMNLTSTHPLTPVITSPSSRTTVSGTTFQVLGSIGGQNFASYKVEVGVGRSPTSWATIATSTTQPSGNGVLATIDSIALPDGFDIFRLTATDTLGKNYQFQVADIFVDNIDAVISSPSDQVLSGSAVNVAGTALTKNGATFANYKLEWGVGSSPTSWSTIGITLTNGGVQPVSNGNLGTWDTSSLSLNQTYSLRLTVNSNSSYQTATNVVVASSVVYKFVFKSGSGEFNQPRGITVDSSNNVYVADTYNHRMQKFSPIRIPPCDSYGDVDFDGVVSLNDYSVAQTLFGHTVTTEQEKRADVDGNNSINIFDTTAISSYVSGTQNSFPICSVTPTPTPAPTSTPTPLPTATPTPAPISANAVYDATLKAPKCAGMINSCDSTTLLNGRNGLGPEPNAPNTINNSCSDGTSGTYHSDESLDRLKISTTDGSALAPGKTAKIEATVWVWGATADHLDLYYTDNANSPVWKFIATLNPSAVGSQTLSTTYTLPSGSLQAIRGNYRYSGVTSSCSTGTYDDHDDLAFETGGSGSTPTPTPTGVLPTSTPTPVPTSTPTPTPTPSSDTTKPTVSITSPLNGSTVPRGTTITIAATASDNVSVTKVEFYVNSSLKCTDTTSPYSCSWLIPNPTNKIYQLQAKAYDAAGNVGSSSIVTVSSK